MVGKISKITPDVSTHSRTKAAARLRWDIAIKFRCFNTQPHEGGCLLEVLSVADRMVVSTHSRTKAAALQRDHVSVI